MKWDNQKPFGADTGQMRIASVVVDVILCRAQSSIRAPSNVIGVHLYSFGGAVRTARWMRERIAG